MVLKFRHYGKQIRIIWKVLKCGGNGWKSSAGPIVVRNEKVLQRAEEERNVLPAIKRKKNNWIGHVLFRTAF
jgi:hypothetical protein